MQLGHTESRPGAITRGSLPVASLPTGITETLPLIIAQGERDGPTLWLTATIHGDEANGLAVAHEVMREDLPGMLRGTVVCLPNLNPAGLRRNKRRPYYGGDLNRCFPESPGEEPESLDEQICHRVFDAFTGNADALIDLHTANIGAIPFNIRHRVLYGEFRSRDDAEALANEQKQLMTAFGLPIVNQYDEYREKELHRSTTGAALNLANIPAMTVELGQHSVVRDEVVDAGVAGCYRVMNAMNMIEAVPPGIADADPGYAGRVNFPVKRAEAPTTREAGILRHRISPGEPFDEGETIADVMAIDGSHVEEVRATADGYLVNRATGAAVYPYDEVGNVVVRDDGPVVLPRDEA